MCFFFFRFAQAKKWLEYYYQELVESDHVIKLQRSFLDKDILYIEMEYANGGSLNDLVHYQLMKMKLLPVKDVWIIFCLLLKGINGFKHINSYFFIVGIIF